MMVVVLCETRSLCGSGCPRVFSVDQPGLQLKVPLPKSADAKQDRITASITSCTSSDDIICESETHLSPQSSISTMDEGT